MTIKQYKEFATNKIEWLKKRFPETIMEGLYESGIQQKIHEIERDIKIFNRKVSLIEKVFKDGLSKEAKEELDHFYKDLRFNKIPKFNEWIDKQRKDQEIS